MNEYKITLTAHYEKTVSVFADSPKQAQEKMKTVLFDTDLIHFTDDDFVCGEAVIADDNEDDCSGCDYLCPVCGCCMCGEDED